MCLATSEELAELEQKLQATGAGSFQLRQIRDACAGLRAAGASTSTAVTAAATVGVASRQGETIPPWQSQRRHAAFISHHQRDSAMEARYLKEQLEGMLGGAKIFLDFDTVRSSRVFLCSCFCLYVLWRLFMLAWIGLRVLARLDRK